MMDKLCLEGRRRTTKLDGGWGKDEDEEVEMGGGGVYVACKMGIEERRKKVLTRRRCPAGRRFELGETSAPRKEGFR